MGEIIMGFIIIIVGMMIFLFRKKLANRQYKYFEIKNKKTKNSSLKANFRESDYIVQTTMTSFFAMIIGVLAIVSGIIKLYR